MSIVEHKISTLNLSDEAMLFGDSLTSICINAVSMTGGRGRCAGINLSNCTDSNPYYPRISLANGEGDSA